MKVLLIIAAVLFLIGCIPVGVLFRYHDGVELKLVIAFLKLGILPKKPLPRKKREKAEAKKAAKAAKKAKAKEEKKKKKQARSLIAGPAGPEAPKQPLGDKIAALIPWAKLAAGLAGEFFHRKLTVTRLRIRAVPAGGDPAKLARTTGRAWEIIGIALPILERAFRIKERKIAVWPDFTAKSSVLEAELCIRVRIGGVVLLALKYGCRALALLLRRKKDSGRQKAKTEETDSNETEAKAVS